MKQIKQMTMIFALLLGLGTQSANAALIGDSYIDGNNNVINIASDDVNNMEWLNLAYTTNMSINAASAAFAVDGWRVANQTEVLNMFNTLFPTYSSLSGTASINATLSPTEYAALSPAAAEFAALLGITGGVTTTSYSYGLYLDNTTVEFTGVQIGETFINLHRDRTTGLVTTVDGSASTMGVYLVRDIASVPEASALMLFAFGLLGLGFSRRRKA